MKDMRVNSKHLNLTEARKVGKNRTSRGKAMAGKFDRILKETVGKTGASQAGGPTPLVDLQGLNAISPINLPPVDSGGAPAIVEDVEGFLDALEDYQRNLKNGAVDLKEMRPLVDKIHRERERLTPILDSLAEDDELKDILNRTLVAASLEITRFSRGDYA
ncbi:MAG: hypothetical protein GY859_23280 [Desulfobacterales bacterium]|nr:hypothetical protein [Desulfobacterales bacterium]